MKFSVTPELAILLKTIRTQNGISSKDLAAEVGKSPSYISKLEAGSVKTIQKELLTSIITFISDGDDFFEECLPAAIKTLDSFMEPQRMLYQTWLYQYDIVDRPIAVPEAMVDDMNRRMKELGLSVPTLTEWANANVDSEMSSSFPVNTVLAIPYDEDVRLLVRVAMDPGEVEALFEKKAATTCYLTLYNLVFMLLRFVNFGEVRKKLPPDQAIVVLKDAATYMGQYQVHSLTGFSHMLSSEDFTDRQKPLAWPYEHRENSTLNEAISFFEEAMDHDALNTKKALDTFMDTLGWDPAFTLKLLSIQFSELEGLSFQNKKNLLEEIEALVERYNQMSDFEKRLETY